MEPGTIAVHAVEVLDNGDGASEVARAVRASVREALAHKALIVLAINPETRTLTDPTTELVEEHANQFVRHIGLSPSGRGS
jgi:hypothetical protein